MSTKKPLTDVSSAQSSARTNASASLSCSHKYRTCVPHTTPSSILKSSHSYYTTTATTREGRRRADSIGNVTSPFISTGGNPLSPHKTPSRAHMLPAHQCDELRNLTTATTHALTNVRLQLHTVMQEVCILSAWNVCYACYVMCVFSCVEGMYCTCVMYSIYVFGCRLSQIVCFALEQFMPLFHSLP
jgi:hypothetical protein